MCGPGFGQFRYDRTMLPLLPLQIIDYISNHLRVFLFGHIRTRQAHRPVASVSIPFMISEKLKSSKRMMKTSCQDSETKTMVMLPICHRRRGENEATFHSCFMNIRELTGGGLPPQQQGPRHAPLPVVASKGCPLVYRHTLARQVWMENTGISMSMGPQPPMTLHPSTSNLPRSRLGTPVPSPSHSLVLTAILLLASRYYGMKRHEMHAMANTYAVDKTSTAGPPSNYTTFLPVLLRHGLDRCELQDLDHGSIAAMVPMGEEEKQHNHPADTIYSRCHTPNDARLESMCAVGICTQPRSVPPTFVNGTNAPTFWYITTCQNQPTPCCARCLATVLLSSTRTVEDPGPRLPMGPRMRLAVTYAMWLATLAVSSHKRQASTAREAQEYLDQIGMVEALFKLVMPTAAPAYKEHRRTLTDTVLAHWRDQADTLDNCVSATPLGEGRITLTSYPCWTRRMPYPCWTHSPHSSCPLLPFPPTTSGTTVASPPRTPLQKQQTGEYEMHATPSTYTVDHTSTAAMVSMGEEEIIGSDVRRPVPPYIALVLSCHVAIAAWLTGL